MHSRRPYLSNMSLITCWGLVKYAHVRPWFWKSRSSSHANIARSERFFFREKFLRYGILVLYPVSLLSMITVRPLLVLLCVNCPHPVTPINYKDMRQRYLQLVINWIYGWFYFFKRYSQVPAKAALQLVRSTRGDPLSHAGGGKAKSWESNTQCAPKPQTCK